LCVVVLLMLRDALEPIHQIKPIHQSSQQDVRANSNESKLEKEDIGVISVFPE
jgi:hypothetical protein